MTTLFTRESVEWALENVKKEKIKQSCGLQFGGAMGAANRRSVTPLRAKDAQC